MVAVAVATPAAAASGGTPLITAAGVTTTGDSHVLIFTVSMADLPASPPSEEGDYEGIVIDFCLPDGLKVIGVGGPWAFVEFGEPFEAGDTFVYNTAEITAGTSTSVSVMIQLSPDVPTLHGELGADVIVGPIGFTQPVAWTYVYGDGSGEPIANCAAPDSVR